jgi:hypothetical protein
MDKRRSTDNTIDKRRGKDSTIDKKRTDNTMDKRKTDNTNKSSTKGATCGEITAHSSGVHRSLLGFAQSLV